MSQNSIKTTETLMLRRIDPIIMLKKYLAGDFKNLKIPNSKIMVSSSVNLNQKIGSDYNSEIYRFNDKINSGQVIVTTNHEQYNIAKENTSDNSISFCRWCRREIIGNPIGIPISMKIDRITNDSYFNVEDTHCSFGCALAILKYIYSCNRLYRDPLYIDAEQLLHCLYYRMYPDRKETRIKEAEDWRLLKSNGGPLTDDEYDSDKYVYLKTPHIITLPIKRQFIKLKLKKK
jgi:hypothetical protein